MGGTFNRSWALAKESYQVLRNNPQLTLFPIVSAIASLIVVISFAVPLFFAGLPHFKDGTVTPIYYVVLFAFYLVLYFVVIFFNAGLVSCSHRILRGEQVTFSDGIADAAHHIVPILGWALISATVGTILRAIAERTGIIGRIVISLLGAAWGVITFFVVPVLIIENRSPIAAIKDSGSLLRKTWGERVVGYVSIGTAMGLLMLLGLLPIAAGIAIMVAGPLVPGITLCVVAVLYWIALAILSSSLSGIFQTALYMYSTTGEVPQAFTPEYIQHAFRDKKAPKPYSSIV